MKEIIIVHQIIMIMHVMGLNVNSYSFIYLKLLIAMLQGNNIL